MTEPTAAPPTDSPKKASAVAEPADYLRGTSGPPPAPSRAQRLWAVVMRHWVVYSSTFLANALPAFFEPILFLTAIGLGLGNYVEAGMAGLPLGAYMGPGALAMTAMFTAAFETTFGTFVRLVYQKSYDGMLATPLTPTDVFLGEALFCAVKGFLFSAIVLCVYLVFGYANGWLTHINGPQLLAIPLVGAWCSFLFAGLGFHVVSLTKNMNNFNFFVSGVLTPMSLFSGMMFPVSDLPVGLQQVAYALPLFHVTELNRYLLFGSDHCVSWVWVCPIYLVVVASLIVWNGVRVMRNRVLQ
ncbi:MAG: ABC transporter permease [Planctomycetes bacterium]|nr:ABC transporter permease [Planctomycetota bacterium]